MSRIILLLAVLFASVSAAQELSVCGEDVDYSPYINPQGQGILKELVDLAAAKAELKVRYLYRPWKRCLAMVQQGELDAMMAVSWSKDRAELLKFPEDEQRLPRSNQRIWLSEFAIFVHKDSTIEWDGERFLGLKAGIGTPLGYISEQRLKQVGALSANAVGLEQGLALVGLVRLDGYVIERHIGWQAAKKLAIEGRLKTLPVPLLQVPWFVAFSPLYFKSHSAQAEIFWRSLESAREMHMVELQHRFGLILPP